MALIGDTPFLELLVRSLVAKGAKRLVILTGYKADTIEDHFRDHRCGASQIRFSREEAPLGTGGALRNAAGFATDPTLLINGDTFFDADLHKLHTFHEERGGRVTLTLKHMPNVSRYGSVQIDGNGRIVGFQEKDPHRSGSGLINGGVSLLSKRFILDLPEHRAFSMEKEIFPVTAQLGQMYGHVQDGPLIDIGTPDSYGEFQSFVCENPGLFPQT
jgi:NDP-sugar pyrophosphorylase family protein